MSPTECFKDHGIPFKRKGKTKQNKTKPNPQRRGKERLMRWSPSTFPGALRAAGHLGAPRLEATATKAFRSPFPTETKTPLVAGH